MLGIQHIWVQYIQCRLQACIVFIKSLFLAMLGFYLFIFSYNDLFVYYPCMETYKKVLLLSNFFYIHFIYGILACKFGHFGFLCFETF